MAIVRYTPFTDFEPFPALRTFQDTMSRLVQQSMAEPSTARSWVPPVDILETENELVVKADIPGVKFEDIDVRLENGTLTVRGERKFEKHEGQNEGKSGWRRIERSYGSFERVFTLPDTVDAERVAADYKAGTLTITLPKKEIAKPRQVKVQINNN